MYGGAAVYSCVLSNQPFSPPLSPHCTELSQSSMNVAWLVSQTRSPALQLCTVRTSGSVSVCVSLMAVNQLIFSHDTEVKILSLFIIQFVSFSWEKRWKSELLNANAVSEEWARNWCTTYSTFQTLYKNHVKFPSSGHLSFIRPCLPQLLDCIQTFSFWQSQPWRIKWMPFKRRRGAGEAGSAHSARFYQFSLPSWLINPVF